MAVVVAVVVVVVVVAVAVAVVVVAVVVARVVAVVKVEVPTKNVKSTRQWRRSPSAKTRELAALHSAAANVSTHAAYAVKVEKSDDSFKSIE